MHLSTYKHPAVPVLFLVALLVLFYPSIGLAQAIVIYQENFESTTGTSLPSGWNVPDSKFGVSADNPLQSGVNLSNRVLTFTAPTTNYDTFSAGFDLSAYKGTSTHIFLTFDFLSNATTDHPGLIGLSPGNQGISGSTGIWQDGSLAAASPPENPGVGQPYIIAGTGAWETATIDVTNYLNFENISALQNTYIAFERWNDASVNSSADVYFDNLKVSAVPEPSTYAMIAGGSCLLLVSFKRTKHYKTKT